MSVLICGKRRSLYRAGKEQIAKVNMFSLVKYKSFISVLMKFTLPLLNQSFSPLEQAKRVKRTACSRCAIRGEKDTVLPMRNSGETRIGWEKIRLPDNRSIQAVSGRRKYLLKVFSVKRVSSAGLIFRIFPVIYDFQINLPDILLLQQCYYALYPSARLVFTYTTASFVCLYA